MRWSFSRARAHVTGDFALLNYATFVFSFSERRRRRSDTRARVVIARAPRHASSRSENHCPVGAAYIYIYIEVLFEVYKFCAPGLTPFSFIRGAARCSLVGIPRVLNAGGRKLPRVPPIDCASFARARSVCGFGMVLKWLTFERVFFAIGRILVRQVEKLIACPYL